MAKIKVEQDGGTITLTRAGETRKAYRVNGGNITVRADDVRSVLAAIPGSALVDGTATEPDTADDGLTDEDDDSPPELPAP